jgi:hypothetical protein
LDDDLIARGLHTLLLTLTRVFIPNQSRKERVGRTAGQPLLCLP